LVVGGTTKAENARKEMESQEKQDTQDSKDRIKHGKRYGNKKILNPETKRLILVKTALSYDKSHPAHQAVMRSMKKESINIPVEIGDTILTGKFKNKKVVVKSIGKDEHGMPTINGRKVATFRTVKPTNEGLMISRVLVEKFRNRLNEGGAAGHAAHIFDDMDLTFGDLKLFISLGLEGKLDVEAPITEKLDGQNISVSYTDKGVVFARNKTHMKNNGKEAMRTNDVKQMFAGRGDLTTAFAEAANDLTKAIIGLTQKQKNKIFAAGSKWMSVEIMFPATQNVIPYGHNLIVFHDTFEVDETGNKIGGGSGEGRILAGMIKQINQDIQNTFQFKGPVVITIPKVKNFSQRKSHYLARVTKLQNQFGLKDNDTVMMWHQMWWELFITNNARKLKYNMPNGVFMKLVRRWAFQELGSFPVNDMKKEIKHSKFLTWVLGFDKGSKLDQLKKNIAPFEMIFLQLGAEILQNASGLLSMSPLDSVKQLKKDIDKSVKELRNTTDIKKISRFKEQLIKLNAIGMDKIVPTEGAMVTYKGKIFKITGFFAPTNQILGLFRYG